MPTKAKFRNTVSEAIHSSATMLCKVDALDEATMQDIDARHRIPLAKIQSDESKAGVKADGVKVSSKGR